MNHKIALLAAVAAVTAASLSLAEIVPKSNDQLAKAAKNIVVGKLNAVYKETTQAGDWEDVAGIAEIAVEKVEHGDGIKPGDIVFARFWNRYWIGKKDPPPYGTGHHLHNKGTQVRAYLDKANGVYEIILPNGLVAIENQPVPTTKAK